MRVSLLAETILEPVILLSQPPKYPSTGITGMRHRAQFKTFILKMTELSWAWWHRLVIPVLGRLTQEDHRFKDSLSK